MSKGMGGHEKGFAGLNDEWLTPPEIMTELSREPFGQFDLDPCAPINPPWRTAKKQYSINDDGLFQSWAPNDRVWLNPPYGPQTGEWLRKLANHGNGMALIFARTETAAFFNYVWDKAHALFFLKGRLHFYTVEGKKSGNNAGAPSVLIAYGQKNAECLKTASLSGKFVSLIDPA